MGIGAIPGLAILVWLFVPKKQLVRMEFSGVHVIWVTPARGYGLAQTIYALGQSAD